MLTDFQKQKMIHLFHFWDYNNNHHLEKTDYEGIVNRIAEERDWEQGSAHFESTYNAVMTNWAQLEEFADDDQDTKISIDEWLAYCNHVVSDEAAYRVNAMEFMMTMLSAVDRDEDGHIMLDDFKMWFRIYNVGADEAETAFRHIDVDGDGKLTIEEIIEAVDDFYHSNARTTAGNFLFGELKSAS